MDDLLPTADEIRASGTPDPKDKDEWLEKALKVIGQFIRDNSDELATGNTVTFQYPTYRDGGEYLRMWQRYYGDVMQALQTRGFTAFTEDTTITSNNRQTTTPTLHISIPQQRPWHADEL